MPIVSFKHPPTTPHDPSRNPHSHPTPHSPPHYYLTSSAPLSHPPLLIPHHPHLFTPHSSYPHHHIPFICPIIPTSPPSLMSHHHIILFLLIFPMIPYSIPYHSYYSINYSPHPLIIPTPTCHPLPHPPLPTQQHHLTLTTPHPHHTTSSTTTFTPQHPHTSITFISPQHPPPQIHVPQQPTHSHNTQTHSNTSSPTQYPIHTPSIPHPNPLSAPSEH